MPTKYVREDSIERAREARNVLFGKSDGRPGLSSYKQRLIIIYVGVLAIAVLVLAAGSLGSKNLFLGHPVLRGEGVVVGKETQRDPGAKTRHFLRIRVSLENGNPAEDLAEIDQEHWQAFAEGDRVAVLYQQSRDGRRARIRECGLVALSDEIR